jgi:hypothetical protein
MSEQARGRTFEACVNHGAQAASTVALPPLVSWTTTQPWHTPQVPTCCEAKRADRATSVGRAKTALVRADKPWARQW